MNEAPRGELAVADADLLEAFGAPDVAVHAGGAEIEGRHAQGLGADLAVPAVEASGIESGLAVWQAPRLDRVGVVDQEQEDVAITGLEGGGVLGDLDERIVGHGRPVQPHFFSSRAGALEPCFRQSSWEGHVDGSIGLDSANGLHVLTTLHGAVPWALAQAYAELVAEHPVLNAQVVSLQNRPWLLTDPSPKVDYQCIDLSQLPQEDRIVAAKRHADLAIWTPFALDQPPLIRGFALILDARTIVFGLVVHHFVADAVSRDLMLARLVELYEGLLARGQSRARAPKLTYLDYLASMNDWFGSPQAQASIAFWKSRLTPLFRPAKDLRAPPPYWRRPIAIDAITTKRLAERARDAHDALHVAVDRQYSAASCARAWRAGVLDERYQWPRRADPLRGRGLSGRSDLSRR